MRATNLTGDWQCSQTASLPASTKRTTALLIAITGVTELTKLLSDAAGVNLSPQPALREAVALLIVADARKPNSDTLGPNAWLVDEMFEQFRSDPTSVSESWREFFEGYKPGGANLVRRPVLVPSGELAPDGEDGQIGTGPGGYTGQAGTIDGARGRHCRRGALL